MAGVDQVDFKMRLGDSVYALPASHNQRVVVHARETCLVSYVRPDVLNAMIMNNTVFGVLP
jgi:hypothetical protein